MENPFENLEFAQSCSCHNSQEDKPSAWSSNKLHSSVYLSTFFLFIFNIGPSWLTEETKD